MKDNIIDTYLKLIKESNEDINYDDIADVTSQLTNIFKVDIEKIKTVFKDEYEQIITILKENNILDNKTLLKELIAWIKDDSSFEENTLNILLIISILEDELNKLKLKK